MIEESEDKKMVDNSRYKEFKNWYVSSEKKSKKSVDVYVTNFNKVRFLSDNKEICEITDVKGFKERTNSLFDTKAGMIDKLFSVVGQNLQRDELKDGLGYYLEFLREQNIDIFINILLKPFIEQVSRKKNNGLTRKTKPDVFLGKFGVGYNISGQGKPISIPYINHKGINLSMMSSAYAEKGGLKHNKIYLDVNTSSYPSDYEGKLIFSNGGNKYAVLEEWDIQEYDDNLLREISETFYDKIKQLKGVSEVDKDKI
ncbi:hypothetical protein [Pseudolactococcus hodotermopsidis]|nr:hypothetical protein [Lactococcus hodotermopsidis]